MRRLKIIKQQNEYYISDLYTHIMQYGMYIILQNKKFAKF